jgi:ATP-dependent DNA ligase
MTKFSSAYDTNCSKNYCSCPSWKFQRKAAHARSCKHLVNHCTEQRNFDKIEKKQHHKWKKKCTPPKVMLFHRNVDKIQDHWMCSFKLDGVMGCWDLTSAKILTRGGIEVDIPERLKKNVNNKSSKEIVLDGEFWSPLKTRQEIISAVQSPKHSDLWDTVNFYVFDLHARKDEKRGYAERLQNIYLLYKTSFVIPQTSVFKNEIPSILESVSLSGGEGLILRDPKGLYFPGKRTSEVIKVKPWVQSTALYKGNKTFIEISTQKMFKINSKASSKLNLDSLVDFEYSGRTNNGKPEYPKLIKCDR